MSLAFIPPKVPRASLLFAWAIALGELGETRAHAQGAEPSLPAVRVATAPILDGRLDDVAWQRAEVIGNFRQRDPDQGAPGTEGTTVRVVFDDTALYIGAHLADSEPERILANELVRDSEFDSDDTFSVVLDTYHDHRNAFMFRVNPNGAMFDGVVRNEADPDSNWDEQWYAATTIGPEGWTVELHIPFKALRFANGPTQVWGIDFERIIRRKNEEVYWTNWDRDFDFTQVSQAGILSGLEGIQQGQRIRLRPYIVGGGESLAATVAPRGTEGVGEVGIDDLKIGVTPNLTADIAVNPDFAQTEIDQQRVNLTRFSLFFPEKRQFFVEGADSFRMSPPAGEFDDSTFELFHSRRIGLSDRGEPITLLAGGKLTGKIGDTDLGVLGARTGTHDAAIGRDLPAETFGAVRFRREMLRRSYVGAIATLRDGPGEAQSTLGADARFVVRRFLTLSALAATTDDGVTSPQWARFLSAEWDSDFVGARAAYLNVDPAFEPAVGYVQRQDRQVQAGFSLRPRPSSGPVRQFEIGPGVVAHHDRNGLLLTRELEFETEAELQSGDELSFSVERTNEYLPEPFEITDSIVLPVGRYEWNSVSMDVRTFEGRTINGSVSVRAGGFYSGTNRSLELSTTLRAGRHLSLSPDYEVNDVSLDEGAFRTHLVGLRANVPFTRNLLTSAFLQYNSEGGLTAIQVRASYIIRNLDNFYLVYNETRFSNGVFQGRSNRALVAKVTYSFHR